MELEKGASLEVEVENQAYGKALVSLWEKLYPNQKDAIHIVSPKKSFHQQFYHDIEWVNDCDALSKKAYALAFDITKDYDIPSHLKRSSLQDYFQPIEGRGMLFVYAKPMLEAYAIEEEDITDFTHYHTPHMYYYSHYADQILPLWLNDYYPDSNTSIDDLFMEDAFLDSIQQMKNLYHELQLEDDPYHTTTFFTQGYLSGLLPSEDIKKQPYYASQQLHIKKMPSSKEKGYSPFVDTYGFMVHKDCPYPNCAKAFMNMVRSKEGIQAYLDHSDGVLLLNAEDISDFHIYDALNKEMISAMNESSLWDMGTIKEKPSIHYKDLYLNTDMVSILQNGIVADKSAKTIQKEIHAYSKTWCLHQ